MTVHHDKLDMPVHRKKGRHIFVNSMSDLFHPKVPSDFIRSVFEVIADTPQHSYTILTKRSARMAALAGGLPWPQHLEVGVSIGLPQFVFRADQLRRVPAAIRFINAEPLLGPLELDLTGIDYVRAAGETEPGFRPCKPEWARLLRD